jgi:large subunit ribosomal protein L24
MNIKKNDNVIVITGKDRGKTGKVSKAMPSSGKVVVEGLNVMKRHERARKQGAKGQTVSVSMPINVSNVMIVDAKTGKRSRVGKKLVGGKYVRIARKSGGEI